MYDLIRKLNAKRLDLLHKVVPATKSIALLLNPTGTQPEVETREAEVAARILGVRLMIVNASSPSEIETAFTPLGEQRNDALLVGACRPVRSQSR